MSISLLADYMATFLSEICAVFGVVCAAANDSNSFLLKYNSSQRPHIPWNPNSFGMQFKTLEKNSDQISY